MAKGFSMAGVMDARDFARGVESGMIKPLEDAQSVLERIAREGADAGVQVGAGVDEAADALDDLEKAARDAGTVLEREMTAAQRDTEQLKGDHRELSKVIKTEAYEQARARRQAAQDTARHSSETMQEIKAEAVQNLAETLSSTDGSLSSFSDGVQGTFGALVGSLSLVNPALAGIGAAGALAIGLIANELTQGEEDTEAFRAKVAELTAEFIESGTIGQRSYAGMLDELQDLVAQTDDAATSTEDLKKIVDDTGLSYRQVTDAYLRGGAALDELIDKQREAIDAEKERIEGSVGGASVAAQSVREELREREDLLTALESQKSAIEAAQQAQEDYLNAGATEFEAKIAQIEAVNDAYDDAAAAADDFTDAETGLFDTDAYIKSMQAREKALRDYQDTLATSGLSSDALSFLNEQGVEAAAAMLSGYQSASPTQKRELERIWSTAAKDNSGTYKRDLTTGLASGTVKGPKIEPTTPSAASIRNELQRDLNRAGSVSITVRAKDRNGRYVD